jgi:uncharacterized protein DUF5670
VTTRSVLWLVVGTLLVFWLIGAVINVIGAVIHALLLIAILIAVVAIVRRNPI